MQKVRKESKIDQVDLKNCLINALKELAKKDSKISDQNLDLVFTKLEPLFRGLAAGNLTRRQLKQLSSVYKISGFALEYIEIIKSDTAFENGLYGDNISLAPSIWLARAIKYVSEHGVVYPADVQSDFTLAEKIDLVMKTRICIRAAMSLDVNRVVEEVFKSKSIEINEGKSKETFEKFIKDLDRRKTMVQNVSVIAAGASGLRIV